MRVRLFLDCIAPLVCAAVFAGEKGDTPPVVIRQVQPGYAAELTKSYMVDPIKVEMIIDSDGVPFLLSTTSGIPDNVVEALAQWRYRPGKKDGREAAFSIMLTVPVRTAIDQRVERSLRRSWRPTKELTEALKTGEQLDAAGAASVEQQLEVNPNGVEARTILLAWEASAGAVADRDQACKLRAQQIAFLIQNAPESEILGSPLAIINAAADPLQDAAGYEQIRRLWLDQLALNPGKPAIIAHAVNFLRLQDPEKTEQVLLSVVNEIQGASVWLGDLDGLAALGVTSLDLKSGLPVSAGERLPETTFALRVRSALASIDNARVLLSALATVTAAGRSLAKAGHLPGGYADFCQALLNHARQIYPDTSESCDTSISVPEDNGAPLRIRVGGKVQQAKLIKQVRPVYPAAAKARQIQGTVRFNAIIDKEGKIRSLDLMNGPLVLYESARDSVRQWVYKPTLLNGEPVEVVTVIDINYEIRR